MLWLRHLEIFWYFLRHVSDFWSWILRSVAYTHRAQGKKKSRRSWRCRKETAKDWKDKRTSAQKAIVVIRCVFWDFLRLFEGPLISPSRPCGACGAPCGSCRIGSTSWTSWTSWTSQSRRVSESAHHTSRVLHVYYTYHTPQTPIPRAQTLSWTLSDQILSEFQYRPNVKSLFGGGDHTKYSTIEAFAWTMHFDIPEWALRQTTLTLRVVRCCQDHCNQFRLVTFGQIWSDLVRLSCQFQLSPLPLTLPLRPLPPPKSWGPRSATRIVRHRKRARPSRRGLQGGRAPQSEKARDNLRHLSRDSWIKLNL